jgi:hypothetical protein
MADLDRRHGPGLGKKTLSTVSTMPLFELTFGECHEEVGRNADVSID